MKDNSNLEKSLTDTEQGTKNSPAQEGKNKSLHLQDSVKKCVGNNTSNADKKCENNPSLNGVNTLECAGTLRSEGIEVLNYEIKYPQLSNSVFGRNTATFNNFYKTSACALQNCSENQLFCEAVRLKNDIGTDFNPYEVNSTYEITYNKCCIVSQFTDKYIFTGGAHGNTTRTSETWNLKTGRILDLCSMFSRCVNYKCLLLENIANQIKRQIECGNNIYFDNWEELICKNFDKDSFYISDCGVTIYYQQYEIGPYSSGIIEFTVPFDGINVIRPC